MGLLKKMGELFPASERPSYYPFPDDAPGMSTDVFREAPIDESDPVAVAGRNELRMAIWGVFMGTPEEIAKHGPHCFPFNELSPDELELMSSALLASYEAELASAHDPRSGRVVQPYIPPGLVEAPEV